MRTTTGRRLLVNLCVEDKRRIMTERGLLVNPCNRQIEQHLVLSDIHVYEMNQHILCCFWCDRVSNIAMTY